ncbi:M4 family metallopeptidase [Lysobacter capsici]|uniref:M4 family metallopeptidase n=1 Tax=Lysobacter capsici TaxID=435897 RepID=UPI001786FBC3|nr:M4 family metallopeptidase [Lysobacter capsici]UOF12729.1 M4 family metallopeptidase [Lysobacter capsici]
MNRNLSILAIAISLASAASAATAAQRVDLRAKDVAKLNQQYRSAVAKSGAAVKANVRHAELIALDAQSSLSQLKSSQDADGSRNYRYQQTFRNVPVFGEHVVVREDANGNVRSLFGRSIEGLAAELPDVAPKLSGAQALNLAKRAALGKRLGQMRIENESSRRMIYIDDNGVAHMSYVVSFFADTAKGEPTRPYVIVDADSGRVLKQWEGLNHALIGTGPGGNTKTGQYEYGTQFAKLDVQQNGSTCVMENEFVKAVDLAGSTSAAGKPAFSYTCPRNTFKAINGGFSPVNDAHFFGKVIYDMYNSYVGMAPLSFKLTMAVHYGTNHDNAYWNGTTMLFGDGATVFYPLVSLDVSGHEVSHGFTEQQSGLLYSGQSGGINEAYSDIAGEAGEFFMNGTNDFMVGAQIKKGSGALRYMDDPTRDGVSIGHASNYRSGMNVHHSSGVYNKAFYTLAKKAGWDTVKAFKVFAKANKDYWTPSTDFNNGACGVQQAATDLGFNVADVTAAFQVVGVACPGGPGPGPGPGTQTYSNGNDVAIGDNTTVESSIVVSGRTGNAPSNASVSVNIVHTYKQDLKVDLVAPDGSLYNIHNRTGGSADNVAGTFTFNLSSETLNGTWKLRVNDNVGGDVGRIDTWSITF